MQTPSSEAAGATPAAAPAPTTAPAPAAPGQDGFVHVQGNATEQVSETGSLFVAYSIIWVILVAFAVTHFRALRGARELLGRLEQVVPERAPADEEA
jgi:CcmD family protein